MFPIFVGSLQAVRVAPSLGPEAPEVFLQAVVDRPLFLLPSCVLLRATLKKLVVSLRSRSTTSEVT